MTSTTRLKAVRVLHLYLGVFFAPTILFFAITGGLQMFGLHESGRGSSYIPPAFLVHLSQLHKKGTLYLPPRKQAPAAVAKGDSAKPDAPKVPAPSSAEATRNAVPMKIFFAATALALVASTCTGLFMSWNYARSKMAVIAVFAAGCACPLVLLFL